MHIHLGDLARLPSHPALCLDFQPKQQPLFILKVSCFLGIWKAGNLLWKQVCLITENQYMPKKNVLWIIKDCERKCRTGNLLQNILSQQR